MLVAEFHSVCCSDFFALSHLSKVDVAMVWKQKKKTNLRQVLNVQVDKEGKCLTGFLLIR